MRRIILVRHGETDFSRTGRYCGWSNPSLSEEGACQAERLCRRLGGLVFEKIYSSDLKRAVETAGIAFGGRHFKKTQKLREMDFGVFEGFRHDELMRKYGQVYAGWLADPAGAAPPGAERFADFRKRILDKFSSILKSGAGDAAIVSHGGALKLMLGSVLNLAPGEFHKVKSYPAGVSIIECRDGLPPEITLLNDTSHLN